MDIGSSSRDGFDIILLGLHGNVASVDFQNASGHFRDPRLLIRAHILMNMHVKQLCLSFPEPVA